MHFRLESDFIYDMPWTEARKTSTELNPFDYPGYRVTSVALKCLGAPSHEEALKLTQGGGE